VKRSRIGAGLLVAAILACGALGTGSAAAESSPAPSSAFSQKAAASRDTVSLYRMPRTLPTGGSGPLAIDQAGNVWFGETIEEAVEPGEAPRHPGRLVRMNRAGAITQVAPKAISGDIAVAPDGSIWFTGFRRIGRVAPSGAVESFLLPEEEETEAGAIYSVGDQDSIVAGPEGDAWFAATRRIYDEEGKQSATEQLIARLTPSGELSEFVLPGGGGYPTRLAVGSDGNIWFTAAEADRVGYITPGGRIEEFPRLGPYADPEYIVSGPDGALWFTEDEAGSVIARMTTAGALSGFRIGGEKETAGAGPLVAGPDGRIWFSAEAGAIGRLDPDGHLSRISLPNHTWPEDLAVGPEGEVWYTSSAEPPCQTGDAACGGGGYYVSGIIGRIAPAPLSVELMSAKAAKAGRRVKVRVACLDGDAGSSCAGRLAVRAGGKTGRRSFSLATDGSQAFSVPLPAAARAKLLHRRRLAVRVEAVLAGGSPASRRFSLRIAAPKKAGGDEPAAAGSGRP